MEFNQLEENIKQYLTLEDKGVVKLLCAAVIANRIQELDPTWIFIVSNSSGGKSELLSALAFAEGCFEQDDLTTRAFISGAKNGAKETSLLFRLPENPIMVIKDLTLLLDKNKEESGQIFSQLRLIYDGKLQKSFGTGEDVSIPVRMGLIAGTTAAIEDTQAKQASMGQRTIKYYMKQPEKTNDILAINRQTIQSKKNKEMRKMMGESFHEFLKKENFAVPSPLPDLPDNVVDDIARLTEMSTRARSSIKRKEYSRDNPIERKDPRELPYRMSKQIANICHALMIINKGNLTPLDQSIIYKIVLDSIPAGRKEVMIATTKFEQVTLKGLAQEMKLPDSSAEMHLDDLVALDMIVKSVGIDRKYRYELRADYRALMARFEDIEQTNQVLDAEEPEYAPGSVEALAKEVGF